MDDLAAHPDHRKQLARLARVEGQIRGVAAMVERGRYCVDILTQLQAARAALARIERDVLETHVANCVADVAASGDAVAGRVKTDELIALLKRAMR